MLHEAAGEPVEAEDGGVPGGIERHQPVECGEGERQSEGGQSAGAELALLERQRRGVARQAACESSAAQRFRFRWLDGPYLRIDSGDRSLGSDGVLSRFTGANSQQWQAVFEANGAWHIVSKVGQKCLTAPTGAGPLTLATCTGAPTQSFTLART